MEDSPVFLPGFFLIVSSVMKDVPKIEEGFRTGKGVGWHEHDHELFHGTEKFFRPNYRAHLVSEWIPALEGVEAKLKAGAKVADVGCGLGTSTILMAQAYPKSISWARIITIARLSWLAKLPSERALAIARNSKWPRRKIIPGAATISWLSSIACTIWAIRWARRKHVLKSLDRDGTWMIVEPFANDRLEDNLNPIGRIFYSASTTLCTPASLSQEVGLALGAQAGEARLTKVLKDAGFTRVRRATQTPFNIILEARP